MIMSILRALLSGGRRTISAWPFLALLWLLAFLIALPAAWLLADRLTESIGPSLVHEGLRQGFDMGWHGELQAKAEGLATTFTPSLAAGGAFFANLEDWATGGLFETYPAIVALALGWTLLWTLLLGAVLTRLANRGGGRFEASEVLGGAGRYFFRFLRLVALAAPLYWLIYRFQRWLFERVVEATRDATAERTAFLYTVAATVLVAALLVLVHLAFDYAKIATVVEGRKSMLLAVVRGFGFVLFYAGRVFGLYLALALLGALLLALYALLAPQAGPATGAGVLLAFVLGQLFLVARLALRLWLLGAQTALYQQATAGLGSAESG